MEDEKDLQIEELEAKVEKEKRSHQESIFVIWACISPFVMVSIFPMSSATFWIASWISVVVGWFVSKKMAGEPRKY